MRNCCDRMTLEIDSDGDVYCPACNTKYTYPTSYKVIGGLTMDIIHKIFDVDENDIYDTGVDFTMNWLILSTSGIHGSYITLTDLETKDELWDEGFATITGMIIQPRMVRTIYDGEIRIQRSDIFYLKDLVRKSVKGMYESQRGNL